MAEAKKGTNKLPKSEITTVRLDPKLRYLAELAARKQRRSLSSFIEWAIEDSLRRFELKEDRNDRLTVMDEAEKLWDVDEADRFVRLALRYPELLTHEDQVLWKLVRENGYVWKGKYSVPFNDWTWTPSEDAIVYDRLRATWPKFLDVASGELELSDLPTWTKKRPASGAQTPKGDGAASKSGLDDMDDDIPF